jgi:hypothetical protein
LVVDGDEGGAEEAVVVDGLEAGRSAGGGGVGNAPAEATVEGGVREQFVGAGLYLAPEPPGVRKGNGDQGSGIGDRPEGIRVVG